MKLVQVNTLAGIKIHINKDAISYIRPDPTGSVNVTWVVIGTEVHKLPLSMEDTINLFTLVN